MTKHRYQVRTSPTSAKRVMSHADFRVGFADARAGRPPRFDDYAQRWEYERGRQFGIVAPPGLKIISGDKLNPEALREYRKFFYGKAGL